MSKRRNIIITLTYSILMLCYVGSYAQNDRLNRAQQLLQSKNADLARQAIDSVILNPETKADFVSWTTRAYIYFEIYKRTDKLKLYSPWGAPDPPPRGIGDPRELPHPQAPAGGLRSGRGRQSPRRGGWGGGAPQHKAGGLGTCKPPRKGVE